MTEWDWNTLAKSILELNTWLVVGVAAVFGLVGGLLQWVLRSDEERGCTSIVAAAVGAGASIAALYLTAPAMGIRLVAIAIIAGYAGKSLLESMTLRLEKQIAKEETRKAKEAGQKVVEKARALHRLGASLLGGKGGAANEPLGMEFDKLSVSVPFGFSQEIWNELGREIDDLAREL